MKKKVLIITTIILLVLMATFGASVALFSKALNGEKTTSVKVGDLTFKYTEVSGIGSGINLVDTDSISDQDGKVLDNYFDFKVEGNLSRSSIDYDVEIEAIDGSTIPSNIIKVYLTELKNGKEEEIESEVKTLSEYDNGVIYSETVLRNTQSYEKNFRLRLWVKDGIDISDYMGTSGSFRVNVNAKSDINNTANDSTTDNDTRILRVIANENYLFTPSEEEKIDYEVSVPYLVEEASIELVPENTKATVEIEKIGIQQLATNEDYSLVVGENYFKATVRSSNGEKTKTYNLKITRIDLPVDTVTLVGKTAEYTGSPIEANEATSITGGEITYFYYNSIDCSGEELEGAPTNVGNYSVKAISSGKTNEYHQGNICVAHTITANTNNNLKSLVVEGYTLNRTFDKDITEYSVITEAANIEILAEVEGPGATVTGIGTKNLTWENNQVFTVTVTSQSGVEKEYTITVNNLRPTLPTLTGGSDNWTSTSKIVSVSAEGSALSGVKEYEYYKTQSTTLPTDETEKTGTGNSITVSDNGITYVYFRTVSNNDNRSVWSNAEVVKVDNNAPSNVVITASDSKASNTWHTADFTLSGSATKNGSSNLSYYYGTDNPETLGNSISVNSNTAGTTYYVKACNEAGICSSNASYIAKLDKDTPAAPTVTGGSTTWSTSRAFILSNPESISGISTYEYYVSNSSTAPSYSTDGTSVLNPSFTVTQDGQYIYFRVVNNATTKGNWSSAYNLYVDKTTYTIGYTLNSGTVATANPTSYKTDTTSFTLNNPTRTGYTFKGWSGTGLTGNTNQTVTISKGSRGNRTYTANWTAKTTTVTLNQQSGSGGTSSVTATYNSAMPSITKPTRSYTVSYNTVRGSQAFAPVTSTYTFGGYYTSTGGNGTQYINSSGTSAKVWDKTDSKYTLYAKWTGGSVTLPTVSNISGYQFDGWWTASSGGTKIGNGGSSYTPTATTTLYAHWKKAYTVTNLVTNGSFENDFIDTGSDSDAYWGNRASNNNYYSVSSPVKYGSKSFRLYSKASQAWPRATFFNKGKNLAGHKLYMKVSSYRDNTNVSPGLVLETSQTAEFWPSTSTGSNNYNYSWNDYAKWHEMSIYATAKYNYLIVMLAQTNGTGTGNIYYDGLLVVDLTASFGSGNEPNQAWCDQNINYFDGSTTVYK